MFQIFVLYIAGAAAVWAVRKRLASRPGAPLPPGPPGIPLLGNINEIAPKDDTPRWKFWRDSLSQYGPISSLNVFGQTIIILNDVEAAVDILDRKSSVTLFDTDLTMSKMCGWGDSRPHPGDVGLWKGIRSNMKREMGTRQAVSRLHPLIDRTTRDLLGRFLEAPENVRDHIERDAAEFFLNLGYGYDIAPPDHVNAKEDRFYELAQRTNSLFWYIFGRQDWIVNQIPLLQYLPAWFPGAESARIAAEIRGSVKEFKALGLKFVQSKMARDQTNSQPSMLARLLQDGVPEPGSEREAATMWSPVEVYLGGTEAAVATFTDILIAMALHPDVQRKAQDELDRVVGPDTLPGFHHRTSLPYIDAVLKETLRWHPPALTPPPHVANTDLIWNGYLLPRGSYFIANIGAFTQNSALYRDPTTFNPDRFLTGGPDNLSGTREPDIQKFVFGFGRRVCPGRFLADDMLFLFTVQVLACFSIAPKVEGASEPKWLQGVISQPGPFELKIQPRSRQHEVLIRTAGKET
ncbi:O-methylsterigmatocystin oxidoreductase [Aspergillus multicolor]|uniref:O-methylsterigmatocystin oxidoreductase n=1 Tax=Aspergillus multicolor TaxID=41759 RepID=UPI003CCD47B9